MREKFKHFCDTANPDLLRLVIIFVLVGLLLVGFLLFGRSDEGASILPAWVQTEHVEPPDERLTVAQKENPDTVAWITIPGTNIDAPVQQYGDNDEILRSHDVPCAEVKADWEMHECPQLASRHYFEDIPFPKSIVEETGRKQYKIKGLPFKTSSDAENPDYLPLPEVGEHNYDVYGTVATKEEIDALLDRWHNEFHKY